MHIHRPIRQAVARAPPPPDAPATELGELQLGQRIWAKSVEKRSGGWWPASVYKLTGEGAERVATVKWVGCGNRHNARILLSSGRLSLVDPREAQPQERILVAVNELNEQLRPGDCRWMTCKWAGWEAGGDEAAMRLSKGSPGAYEQRRVSCSAKRPRTPATRAIHAQFPFRTQTYLKWDQRFEPHLEHLPDGH